jgi:hypothetical protein
MSKVFCHVVSKLTGNTAKRLLLTLRTVNAAYNSGAPLRARMPHQ